jgi:transcriptional regulator with XRE-family HTH domain
MPKQGSSGKRSAQPVEGETFRGEFTRLEREYVLARSILAARKATGMTKAAFAKAVGTSKGKLARWERAETIPRLESLQRIADVTGLSFQIGIEPLNAPSAASASGSKTGPASSGRQRAAGKATTKKSSSRTSARRTTRSAARKDPASGARKTVSKRTAGKTTARKSRTSRKTVRKKTAAKTASGTTARGR